MRPIPKAMRAKLAEEPRMKHCVLELHSVYGPCDGRIEWEHVWTYAGRQVNEPWAIIGVCHNHHARKNGDPRIKAAFETASLRLAQNADFTGYPRKDWNQIKRSLGMNI